MCLRGKYAIFVVGNNDPQPLYMIRPDFTGLGVAMVTPMTPDAEIDFAGLDSHIDRLISHGVDYLVALGTTAETPTLPLVEYEQVRRHIAEKVAGRVPVVLGLGGNDTRLLCRRIANLGEEIHRYAAILSVTPYYNKPSQEGLYRHYCKLAEASEIPLILYNVPGRTGVNLSPDTVIRLAHACKGRIVAVKEASGSVEQAARIVENAPEGFQVLSGDDALALDMIAKGAKGVISVIANALPHTYGQLIKFALAGENDKAAEIQHRLQPLYRLLFCEGNPSGIKSLMALHPHISHHETLRLPLTPVSQNVRAQIAKEIEMLQFAD